MERIENSEFRKMQEKLNEINNLKIINNKDIQNSENNIYCEKPEINLDLNSLISDNKIQNFRDQKAINEEYINDSRADKPDFIYDNKINFKTPLISENNNYKNNAILSNKSYKENKSIYCSNIIEDFYSTCDEKKNINFSISNDKKFNLDLLNPQAENNFINKNNYSRIDESYKLNKDTMLKDNDISKNNITINIRKFTDFKKEEEYLKFSQFNIIKYENDELYETKGFNSIIKCNNNKTESNKFFLKNIKGSLENNQSVNKNLKLHDGILQSNKTDQYVLSKTKNYKEKKVNDALISSKKNIVIKNCTKDFHLDKKGSFSSMNQQNIFKKNTSCIKSTIFTNKINNNKRILDIAVNKNINYSGMNNGKKPCISYRKNSREIFTSQNTSIEKVNNSHDKLYEGEKKEIGIDKVNIFNNFKESSLNEKNSLIEKLTYEIDSGEYKYNSPSSKNLQKKKETFSMNCTKSEENSCLIF